jgi:hypothetical protein
MPSRFALVLDSDAGEDLACWRASHVAPTAAGVSREHDGHYVVVPRRPTDRRVEAVIAVHRSTGAEAPAGIYEIAGGA